MQKTSRPIHVLIQGNYTSVEDARAARDTFPNAINSPERVWIRQFKKIQELINAEASAKAPVGAASAATKDPGHVGAASTKTEDPGNVRAASAATDDRESIPK